MKTIIAGSRDITDSNLVAEAVELSGFSGQITEVVCGMARGVDLLGKSWAESWHIPVAKFHANWDMHGNAAGYKRNERMSEYADALIAIWDGSSKGTASMINIARARGLRVYVHYTKEAITL